MLRLGLGLGFSRVYGGGGAPAWTPANITSNRLWIQPSTSSSIFEEVDGFGQRAFNQSTDAKKWADSWSFEDGSQTPVYNGDALVFDGSNDWMLSGFIPSVNALIELPEATNLPTGRANPVPTGMCFATDGNIYIACNFGAIIKVNKTTGALIQNIDLETLYPAIDFSVGTCQGLTQDGGVLRLALRATGDVLHINEDGTLAGGDYNIATGTVNGLARDVPNSQDIVTVDGVSKRYTNAGTYIEDVCTFPAGVDQIWHDGTNDILYGTTGDNGDAGQIYAYHIPTGSLSDAIWLQKTYAMEGVLLDYANDLLYITSDEGYHGSARGSGEDQLQVYNFDAAGLIDQITTTYTAFTIAGRFKIDSVDASSDVLLGWGNTTDSVSGITLFAIGGASGDSIRIQVKDADLNAFNANFTLDTNLTEESNIIAEVDFANSTVKLWQDGILNDTISMTGINTEWYYQPFSIGAGRNNNGDTRERPSSLTLSHLSAYGDVLSEGDRDDLFDFMTPTPTAPVNVIAPSVAGSESVGGTLTGDNGTWTGYPAPTYTYKWFSEDDGEIVGETGASYVGIDVAYEGDRIRRQVTATNSAGSTSAFSDYTGVISPASSFVPSDIAGYAADIDASQSTITESGGVISEVSNIADAANPVAPSGGTAPETGTQTIGSLNAIDFSVSSGSSNLLFTTALDGSNGFSITIVVDFLSNPSGRRIWGYADSSLELRSDGSGFLLVDRGGSNIITGTTVMQANTTYVITVISGAAGTYLYIDGVLEDSDGTARTYPNGVQTIGRNNGFSFLGALGQFIAYEDEITTDNVADLYGYCATKWSM
jgi:hypothetical protein